MTGEEEETFSIGELKNEMSAIIFDHVRQMTELVRWQDTLIAEICDKMSEQPPWRGRQLWVGNSQNGRNGLHTKPPEGDNVKPIRVECPNFTGIGVEVGYFRLRSISSSMGYPIRQE